MSVVLDESAAPNGPWTIHKVEDPTSRIHSLGSAKVDVTVLMSPGVVSSALETTWQAPPLPCPCPCPAPALLLPHVAFCWPGGALTPPLN